MYIKTIKTKIYLYCEGKSEKNYFEALKRNTQINKNYVLSPIQDNKLTDLKNAINHSRKNPEILKSRSKIGLNLCILFFCDTDKFENGDKKIDFEIENLKKCIYFSYSDFEDFLTCHKTKNPYTYKGKPNISRELLKEIENLTLKELKEIKVKPNKYKNFKTIYDFLVELFEKKI